MNTYTQRYPFGHHFRFKIVLKRPSNEDYMWTVYTKQFEAGVWGVLTLLTTALCFSLYFASRCSSREQKLSPSDAFIVGVGMIFGQGGCYFFRWYFKMVLCAFALLN